MYFDPHAIRPMSGQYINGAEVTEGEARAVVSPSDANVALPVRWADAALVDRAVTSARAAWRTSRWGELPPRERAALLYRWADLVEAHADEIAGLEAVVSARLYPEVMARDVKVVSGVLRYFGEYADKVDGAVTPAPRESFSFTVHEPYGVVAAIAPWNFPIILAAWKFAPALAAGNAVVLKPSEMTPFAAARIAALAVEAGLPAGLFNVVHGGGEVGAALVQHPGVDYVTFTGSSMTGARIMADAATHGLKPVSLELGGKGPQLVFADAPNLDKLAATIARGITYNAGQVCFAGSRLVVERRVADELLDRVAGHMRGLTPGTTWEEGTGIPPIISARQLDRIAGIVDDAIADGAEAVTGAERWDGAGAGFYAPTILRGVTTTNRAYREEIFGPVLAVQEFDGEEEGLSLANHPDYGLTASVHTADVSRAFRAARAIESGTVWINDWGRRTDFTAPFGGYKRSGIGKDMGRAGFEKYMKTKAIWLEIAPTP